MPQAKVMMEEEKVGKLVGGAETSQILVMCESRKRWDLLMIAFSSWMNT